MGSNARLECSMRKSKGDRAGGFGGGCGETMPHCGKTLILRKIKAGFCHWTRAINE